MDKKKTKIVNLGTQKEQGKQEKPKKPQEIPTDIPKGLGEAPKDPNYEAYNNGDVPIKGDFVLQILPFLREVTSRERSFVYSAEGGDSEQPTIAMTELGARASFLEQNIWNWHLSNVEAGLTTHVSEETPVAPAFSLEDVEKD